MLCQYLLITASIRKEFNDALSARVIGSDLYQLMVGLGKNDIEISVGLALNSKEYCINPNGYLNFIL